MDIKLTPKPANEVQSEEGFKTLDVLKEEVTPVDEEFASIDLPKLDIEDTKNNKKTDNANLENNAKEKIIFQPNSSVDNQEIKIANNEIKLDTINTESELQLKDTDNEDVGIKVDPMRENEDILEISDLKKETSADRLNPEQNRHSLEDKKPKVKIQNRTEFDKGSLNQIGDILEKKTKFLSTNLAEVNEKLKKDDIDREKETDLLRTNAFYAKKMYEEIVELKKIVRTQGYLKHAITFIFLILTIWSMYYGMQLFDSLAGGGISNILSSIKNLAGGGNMQANMFQNVLQSAGNNQVDLGGLSGASGSISSGIDVNEIVNQFLKK